MTPYTKKDDTGNVDIVENTASGRRTASESDNLLHRSGSIGSSRHEIPVVVIEGLREANDDDEKSDKDVVINELTKVMPDDSSFTPASVVRAIRLPFVTTKDSRLIFGHILI